MQSIYTGTSPLDDYQYSERGLNAFLELAEYHGIVQSKKSKDYIYVKPAGSTHWKQRWNGGNIRIRPGRGQGVIIINFDHQILQKGKSYTLGAAFAALECMGDMKEATRRLRKMGFGTPLNQ